MNQLSTKISTKSYYKKSIDHRNTHKCGGYPFSNGEFLNKIVTAISAKSVLEIGTAIGYSAFCFADGNDVEVFTIDMVEEHGGISNDLWTKQGVGEQITFLLGKSADVLPTLSQQFDIVFFDGFAPNPEEVKQYDSVLKNDGLLISTNLSWNSTTPRYIKEIEDTGMETLQFDDTAFSSRNKNILKKCVDLWENKDRH